MDLNRAKENSQKREAQLEHDILMALNEEINKKSSSYSDEKPHVVVCDRKEKMYTEAIRPELHCNKVSTDMINRIISTMDQRGFNVKYECDKCDSSRCTLSVVENWN